MPIWNDITGLLERIEPPARSRQLLPPGPMRPSTGMEGTLSNRLRTESSELTGKDPYHALMRLNPFAGMLMGGETYLGDAIGEDLDGIAHHPIYDQNRKRIGYVDVSPRGDNLKIEYFKIDEGQRGRNSLANVVRQLADYYPEAKKVTGERVTGAHQGMNEYVIPDRAKLAARRTARIAAQPEQFDLPIRGGHGSVSPYRAFEHNPHPDFDEMMRRLMLIPSNDPLELARMMQSNPGAWGVFDRARLIGSPLRGRIGAAQPQQLFLQMMGAR